MFQKLINTKRCQAFLNEWRSELLTSHENRKKAKLSKIREEVNQLPKRPASVTKRVNASKSKIINQSQIEEEKRNNMKRIESEMMEKYTFKPNIKSNVRYRVDDDVVSRNTSFLQKKEEKLANLKEKFEVKTQNVPKINNKHFPLADELEQLPVADRLYNYNLIYKQKQNILKNNFEEPLPFAPMINKNTELILRNKRLIEEELKRKYQEEEQGLAELMAAEHNEINDLESDEQEESYKEEIPLNEPSATNFTFQQGKQEDRIRQIEPKRDNVAFKLNAQVERCLQSVKDKSTKLIVETKPSKKERINLPDNVRKALEAYDNAVN